MRPLRIEQLENEGNDTFIGIAELQNSKGLKQDQLIQLATSISNESLTVQLLNGKLVADETHLLSAVQNAVNAKNGGYMLSRSLDVEIIVYASAQKQIGRAFDTLGVSDGLNEVAVTVVGTNIDSVKEVVRDLIDKIGNETIPSFAATNERIDRIKDHYQITDKELETIADSDDAKSQLKALSRCLVSRVSLVAFDS